MTMITLVFLFYDRRFCILIAIDRAAVRTYLADLLAGAFAVRTCRLGLEDAEGGTLLLDHRAAAAAGLTCLDVGRTCGAAALAAGIGTILYLVKDKKDREGLAEDFDDEFDDDFDEFEEDAPRDYVDIKAAAEEAAEKVEEAAADAADKAEEIKEAAEEKAEEIIDAVADKAEEILDIPTKETLSEVFETQAPEEPAPEDIREE